MKIPKIIKIKAEVLDKLQKTPADYSKMYMLGANDKNIVTQAVRLKSSRDSGCQMTRGVDHEEILRVISILTKKHCTPIAFLNYVAYQYLSWKKLAPGAWNYRLGSDPYENPGTIFIIFDPPRLNAIVADSAGRRHIVKVKICR